jgi:hypothetical protein
MKLEFCSEFSEGDINWVHVSQIPLAKAIQVQARPTKSVLGIILLLEQGRFPVVKINSISEYPLKDSWGVHEAYIRCHVSVVPTVSVEEVKENVDTIDPPIRPEEPDWDGPIGEAERE